MSDLPIHKLPDDVEPSGWTLRVTGEVSTPLRLIWGELAELPVETVTDDFECTEGWTATDLSWRGVRVSHLLKRATPTVDEGYVLVHAMDGDYACAFPRNHVENAMLAFELDGEDLPIEHGGPAPLVPTVADSDCWESVKRVAELEVRRSEPVTGDTAEEIATGRLG